MDYPSLGECGESVSRLTDTLIDQGLGGLPGVGPIIKGAHQVDSADKRSHAQAKRDRIKRWKRTNSGTLTVQECAQLWVDAGGKEEDAPMAAAITRPESGGSVDIVNSIGATGLWQIHPGGPQYKNAWRNARAAVAKRRAKPHTWGPNPWAVCHDAACSNLAAAAALVGKVQDEGGILPDSIPSPSDVGDGVAGAITAVFEPIGSFFKIITDADTWIRIGKVLLGAILILLAINYISGGGSIASKAAKAF